MRWFQAEFAKNPWPEIALGTGINSAIVRRPERHHPERCRDRSAVILSER
jgi:hypothetical protein